MKKKKNRSPRIQQRNRDLQAKVDLFFLSVQNRTSLVCQFKNGLVGQVSASKKGLVAFPCAKRDWFFEKKVKSENVTSEFLIPASALAEAITHHKTRFLVVCIATTMMNSNISYL